jgi:hypothetical protein
VDIAVELRPVEELVPYEKNARKHSATAVKRLVKIIGEMGWTNPILVDVDGVIAGHKRRLAALEIYSKGGRIKLPGGQELPAGMVPVLDVTGWSEAQRRAYILADNQTTLESEWDEGVLRLELAWLKEVGEVEMSLTGFDGKGLEKALGIGQPGAGEGEGFYTRKIVAPIYEPTGDAPEPGELYDDAKARALIAEIRAADLPEDVALFLEKAAERHTVFNFRRIADFYASAPAETQRLMERSALVIIDFNQAIENGFVRLTKKLGDLVAKDHPDGGEDE